MLKSQETIASHVLLACLVATVLGSSPSYATTLQKFSLDDLVGRADTIIVGKCEKTETIWLDRKIYTIATIRVSRSFKGKIPAGNSVKVYILGGRVKKPIPVKMHVPGAAKVDQGEEMVLFLKAEGIKKKHRFVGMAQGKIPIKIDIKTGKQLIRYYRPIKGVMIVDRKGQVLSSSSRPESTKEDSLENFLSKIRQIMAEREAKDKKIAKLKNQPKNSTQNEKGGVK